MSDPVVPTGPAGASTGVSQQQFEARCAALIAASALLAGRSFQPTPAEVKQRAEQFERWLLRPVER